MVPQSRGACPSGVVEATGRSPTPEPSDSPCALPAARKLPAGTPGQAWRGGTSRRSWSAALSRSGTRRTRRWDRAPWHSDRRCGTCVCSEPQTARSLRPPSGPHGGWDIPGLSHEIREKLTYIQSATLRQATRISGVTPAAVAILMVYFQKHRMQRASYGAKLPETPLPGV